MGTRAARRLSAVARPLPKLLAAIGAWLGWHALPSVVVLASASGCVFGVLAFSIGAATRSRAFAFGPFLVLAALSGLLMPIPNEAWHVCFASLSIYSRPLVSAIAPDLHWFGQAQRVRLPNRLPT